MKRFVQLICVMNLVMALGLPALAAASGHRFFIGLWEGIDTQDGSDTRLSISDNDRDGILEVRLTDGFFSVCVGQGFSSIPGLVSGPATVQDKTLSWGFVFQCYDPKTNSLVEIEKGKSTFQANRKDKLLIGDDGIIYHRVSRR